MFIHVVHKLNWPILVLISAFAFPLGGVEFLKLVEIWKVRSAPLVQGKVLRREEIRKWGGIPATKLTLRVTNSEDTVIAIMPNKTADKFAGVAQFHYSGDPRQAVHLEGEDNPLWLVIIMWGMPALLWVAWFSLRGKPQWRLIFD